MRGCSLLGMVVGVLAAASAGCGDDDRRPALPDAGSYDFDAGTMDGGPVMSGGRRDGGQGGSAGGISAAGIGSAAGTGPISGGVSGGPGIGAGGSGPSGGAISCDANGTCLYPGGLICFADGQCCYIDEVVDNFCCVDNRCQLVPPWIGLPMPRPDAGPPEPWVPPLDEGLVGEPGWRDSKDPLCFSGSNQAFGQGIWSDSRGVFVSSVVPQPYDPMNPNGCAGCIRERLDFNDGTGWREIEGVWSDENSLVQRPGLLLVTGFDDGRLVLYGYPSQGESTQLCGLSLLEDGVRTCHSNALVTDVAMVNDTLAYALVEGRMVRYDGANWGPLPIQMPAQELQLMWADPSVVMITAYAPGIIYTLRDGAFNVEDTRTLETFLAIFGFAPNDVFAGTWQGGLFHYDGTAWTKLDVPAIDCGEPAIYSMWGANGIVYFASQSAFMRWNGTSVEKLAQLDCNRVTAGQAFTSLWGNSENEVFVGLTDTVGQTVECGPTFLLHYDGEKFHHM